MKENIRILVVGDDQVGKSSFISAFISQQYCENVPAVHPDNVLPGDFGGNLIIMDSSNHPKDSEILDQKIRIADSIVILFDVTRQDTMASVVDKWIPRIFQITSGYTPLIICQNKSDMVGLEDELRKGSNDPFVSEDKSITSMMDQEKFIISYYTQCSTVNCSDGNIDNVFKDAETAVSCPLNPLFDISSNEFTTQFYSAFRRVFRCFAKGVDGLLTDAELCELQTCCFESSALTDDEIDALKKQILFEKPRARNYENPSRLHPALAITDSTLIKDNKFTLAGFLCIMKFFVFRNQREAPWQVLRSFGYRDDLSLQLPDYLTSVEQDDNTKSVDSSQMVTELSSGALEFLIAVAQSAIREDREQQRCLHGQSDDDFSNGSNDDDDIEVDSSRPAHSRYPITKSLDRWLMSARVMARIYAVCGAVYTDDEGAKNPWANWLPSNRNQLGVISTGTSELDISSQRGGNEAINSVYFEDAKTVGSRSPTTPSMSITTNFERIVSTPTPVNESYHYATGSSAQGQSDIVADTEEFSPSKGSSSSSLTFAVSTVVDYMNICFSPLPFDDNRSSVISISQWIDEWRFLAAVRPTIAQEWLYRLGYLFRNDLGINQLHKHSSQRTVFQTAIIGVNSRAVTKLVDCALQSPLHPVENAVVGNGKDVYQSQYYMDCIAKSAHVDLSAASCFDTNDTAVVSTALRFSPSSNISHQAKLRLSLRSSSGTNEPQYDLGPIHILTDIAPSARELFLAERGSMVDVVVIYCDKTDAESIPTSVEQVLIEVESYLPFTATIGFAIHEPQSTESTHRMVLEWSQASRKRRCPPNNGVFARVVAQVASLLFTSKDTNIHDDLKVVSRYESDGSSLWHWVGDSVRAGGFGIKSLLTNLETCLHISQIGKNANDAPNSGADKNMALIPKPMISALTSDMTLMTALAMGGILTAMFGFRTGQPLQSYFLRCLSTLVSNVAFTLKVK